MYTIIKRLADERGMTIADISRKTGISEQTFSMLKTRENSGGHLNVANVIKVADALGVSVGVLMNIDERPE